MGIDKVKNTDSNFSSGNDASTGASGDASAVSVDKNENADSGYDAGGGTSDMGIDEDKDVADEFGNVVANWMVGNVGKQLKVSKSKVFMAVINHKKSHLPKKNPDYKIFLNSSYSFLTSSKPKSYNSNLIIYIC